MDIGQVLTPSKGCPICSAGQASVDRFYRWFALEYYHEPAMCNILFKGGFCREHARHVANLGEVLAYPLDYVTRAQISRRMSKKYT